MAAVRAGADPVAAAGELLAGLTDAELLGLLDGDEPFWPGMPDMMGKGYNLEPIVAGARAPARASRASGSATARAAR